MPTPYYIFLCFTLFSIGIMGVLIRRNALVIFLCVELMLNAVNLLLVVFSRMHALSPNPIERVGATDGQIFVFFIMVVAAAEVAVGLAIIVLIYRKMHSVDIDMLNRLKN